MPLAATGGVLSSDLGGRDVDGVAGGVVFGVELERFLVDDGVLAAREIWDLDGIATFRVPRRGGSSLGSGAGFGRRVAAEGFSIPYPPAEVLEAAAFF